MRLGSVWVRGGGRGAGQPPQDAEWGAGEHDSGEDHDDHCEAARIGGGRIGAGKHAAHHAGHGGEGSDADHGDERVEQVEAGAAAVMHAPPACGKCGKEGRKAEETGQRALGFGMRVARLKTEEEAVHKAHDEAAKQEKEKEPPVFRPRSATREGNVFGQAGLDGFGEGHAVTSRGFGP